MTIIGLLIWFSVLAILIKKRAKLWVWLIFIIATVLALRQKIKDS